MVATPSEMVTEGAMAASEEPKVWDTLPIGHQVRSVVIHGSHKMATGETVIGVSVMSSSDTGHHLFPKENEPHLVRQASIWSWLMTQPTKTHNTFVLAHELMTASI